MRRKPRIERTAVVEARILFIRDDGEEIQVHSKKITINERYRTMLLKEIQKDVDNIMSQFDITASLTKELRDREDIRW